jgi:hypothetical protein
VPHARLTGTLRFIRPTLISVLHARLTGTLRFIRPTLIPVLHARLTGALRFTRPTLIPVLHAHLTGVLRFIRPTLIRCCTLTRDGRSASRARFIASLENRARDALLQVRGELDGTFD